MPSTVISIESLGESSGEPSSGSEPSLEHQPPWPHREAGAGAGEGEEEAAAAAAARHLPALPASRARPGEAPKEAPWGMAPAANTRSPTGQGVVVGPGLGPVGLGWPEADVAAYGGGSNVVSLTVTLGGVAVPRLIDSSTRWEKLPCLVSSPS